MRWWPWTRIREMERERDRADVLLTAMVERADNAEAEVRRLTDIIVQMRRDGFHQPTQPSHKRTTQPLPPELATFLAGFPPGPIADANEKAIRAALAKGTPVAEIIKHVKEVSG